MAANTAGPIWEIAPVIKGVQFTSADTTTKKSIVTGQASTSGAAGTRIDSIMISTNDTSAVNLAFYINDTVTDLYIGVVTVPIGSGYTTVARVEGIGILALLTGYLVLPPSYILKCNCVATMTAANTTDVVVMGGDY